MVGTRILKKGMRSLGSDLIEPTGGDVETIVVGHRNPDTDCITSAIAYAELLRTLFRDQVFTPASAGHLNDTTKYVLSKYGVPEPRIITDITPRAEMFCKRGTVRIREDASVAVALELFDRHNVKVMPVTDAGDKCIGTLSLLDLLSAFFHPRSEAALRTITTSIATLCRSVKGHYLNRCPAADYSQQKTYVIYTPSMSYGAFVRSTLGFTPADWRLTVFITGYYPAIIDYIIAHRGGIIIISLPDNVVRTVMDTDSETDTEQVTDADAANANAATAANDDDTTCISLQDAADPCLASSAVSLTHQPQRNNSTSSIGGTDNLSILHSFEPINVVAASKLVCPDISLEQFDITVTFSTAEGTGDGLLDGADSLDVTQLFQRDLADTLVITSRLDVSSLTLLAKQSTPIRPFVNTNQALIVGEATSITEVKSRLSQHHNVSVVTVVSDAGLVTGLISQSDIIDTKLLNIVLIDHNDLTSAVPGITSDGIEIVEIIDHHKLSNPSTKSPIRMTTMPVCSTGTIITNLFIESCVAIPPKIASILLCGILCNSAALKSSKVAREDLRACQYLARIILLSSPARAPPKDSINGTASRQPVNVKPLEPTRTDLDTMISELGVEIFALATSLINETDNMSLLRGELALRQIPRQTCLLGYVQLECMFVDLIPAKVHARLLRDLHTLALERNLCTACLMLVDINSNNSILLLACPEECESMLEYTPHLGFTSVYDLHGITDLKSQVLPYVIESLYP